MRWYALLLLVATGLQAATAAAVPSKFACAMKKVTSPKMETFTVIGNNDPVRDPNASPTDLNLSRTPNSRTEQIMTFKPPEEAIGKQCHLEWSVASTKESGLRVEKDSHIQILEIEPDGKEQHVGGAEFGDWVGVDDGRSHYNGSVKCKDTVRLRLVMRFEGKVFLKQNERNGFYLRYQYCE